MAPQTFKPVWYMSEKPKWDAKALRPDQAFLIKDSGTLIINEDSLEFHSSRKIAYGHAEPIIITKIKRVSIGKQGRDFINKWVKVEYGDGPVFSTAYFAYGGGLGWGGILGGTKRILKAVQPLVEEPNQ